MAAETDSVVIAAIENWIKANRVDGSGKEIDYEYIKTELNMDTLVQTTLGFGVDDARSYTWNEQIRQKLLKQWKLPKYRKRYA